ncbi:MAG TPA: BadF/BadG/BcrA/BcrD ATPase family protein [Armatimonadota bacterium]|jgi:N-acetylglucosamine kinase-like BadF-type ATPase
MTRDEGGIFVGVDSGQRPARALVVDGEGKPVGEGAGSTVSSAVELALAPSGAGIVDITSVGVAITQADERDRAAVSLLFPNAPVIVAERAKCALYGASGLGRGVWLDAECGFAYARGTSGLEATAGGWGPVAGDEGSRRWLGLEGVRAVFRAHDGRTGDTALHDLALKRFSASSVTALRDALDEGADVSEFAADVSMAAAAGDKLAAALTNHAALHLANLALAAARAVFEGDPEVAVFGSGYAFEDETVAGQLDGWLERLLPTALRHPALATPTVGALLLACAAAGLEPEELDWRALLAADARLNEISSTKGKSLHDA